MKYMMLQSTVFPKFGLFADLERMYIIKSVYFWRLNLIVITVMVGWKYFCALANIIKV
jgi:hypothetical protein